MLSFEMSPRRRHILSIEKTVRASKNQLTIPEGKKTLLKLRVSHHPHGDWQLRVVANGKDGGLRYWARYS